MGELLLELLWSVAAPVGSLLGAVLGLMWLSDRLLRRRPRPPEHVGATEDWSPTGEYRAVSLLDADDAEVHDELRAIQDRLSTELAWVEASAREWLGDTDPADELAYLGLSDTCGYRQDPATGKWMLVPIGGNR